MAWLIVLGIVAGIAWAVYTQWKLKKNLTECKQALFSEHAFNESQSFTLADNKSFIALDEGAGLLCVIENVLSGASGRVESYRKLNSVELIVDGDVVTSTNRGSQLVGAAIGEALLGPAGALVGALSGSKKSSQQVDKIALKMTFDDLRKPVSVVNFLYGKTKKGSSTFKKTVGNAEHWLGLLSVLLKRSDKEFQIGLKDVPQAIAASSSVADELAKLADLTEKGLLSADEFQAQKQRLLLSDGT